MFVKSSNTSANVSQIHPEDREFTFMERSAVSQKQSPGGSSQRSWQCPLSNTKIQSQSSIKVVQPQLAKEHKHVSNRIDDAVQNVLFRADVNLKELDKNMDEQLAIKKETGSYSFSKDDLRTNDSDNLLVSTTDDG